MDNEKIIDSIMSSISLKLESVKGDNIVFTDNKNNKTYDYKSVYSTGHFYTEDDKRLFRCLQNGNIIGYVSASVLLKNVKKSIDEGQDVFVIRYSSGIESNNVCFRFYTEDSEQSILIGKNKDGVNYIRFTRFFNPEDNTEIGDSINYEIVNGKKQLAIYDFNKSIKASMTIKDNKYVTILSGTETDMTIKPVDMVIDSDKDIDHLIGTLIVNRREIIDVLLNKFKKVAPEFYGVCRELYPDFEEFVYLLSQYSADKELDDMVEKYSEFVQEAKKLTKKINKSND